LRKRVFTFVEGCNLWDCQGQCLICAPSYSFSDFSQFHRFSSVMELAFPEIYTAEDLISFCSTSLPCYGTVCRVVEKSGDFFYVELPEEWQRARDFFVAAAKTLYQYDKKVFISFLGLLV
jgi:hypothetical protein